MKIDTVYGLIYLKGKVPGNDMTYVRLRDAMFRCKTRNPFPKGVAVPYPTNFQKLSEMPRELSIVPQEDSIDVFARQRHERTG